MLERDEELFEERSAILEFDGGHSRAEAERLAAVETEAHRMRCEIDSVFQMQDRDAYFALVLQKRGKAAHDKLKAEVERREPELVAALPSKTQRDQYLYEVEKARGKAAHDKLRAEAMAEYLKG